MAAQKSALISAGWISDEQGRQRLNLSLEVDGVTIEGLSLRMTSNRTMPDRKVMCQIEHRLSPNLVEPLARIEWRPLRPHRNYQRGPVEYRLIDIPGSHNHSFDLNWFAAESRMLKENLPLAVPILPDPEGFHQLLALASKEFRIINMGSIPIPPWDLML